MRNALALSLVALALSPLTALGQEYVIQIKQPGLGDRTKVKASNNTSIQFKLVDDNNNVVEDKTENKSHLFIFSEVGLERAAAGDALVKIKRRYDHAERVVSSVRNTLPYQGKTLHIDQKDGHFRFQIEGDDNLSEAEAAELNEEFNKGDFRKLLTAGFLPRKAVKINEAWKLDVAPLARDFGKDGKIVLDDVNAKGTGKLLKVYQKNGKQFGVIELAMHLPVTHMVNDGNKSEAKDSKITISVTRDGPIDGSLDESRLMVSFDGDISATINANGNDYKLAITVRAKAEESRTLAPAK